MATEPIKNFKTSIEYRVICRGGHTGRLHIYRKPSLSKARKATEDLNETTTGFTGLRCVPFKMERRTVTTWEEDTGWE